MVVGWILRTRTHCGYVAVSYARPANVRIYVMTREVSLSQKFADKCLGDAGFKGLEPSNGKVVRESC